MNLHARKLMDWCAAKPDLSGSCPCLGSTVMQTCTQHRKPRVAVDSIRILEHCKRAMGRLVRGPGQQKLTEAKCNSLFG